MSTNMICLFDKLENYFLVEKFTILLSTNYYLMFLSIQSKIPVRATSQSPLGTQLPQTGCYHC